jgi:nitrous oxidase accessory protein NosD
MKRFLFSAAMLGVVTICLTSQAKTLHVDIAHPKADDAQSGTADVPFKSINAATKVAQPGDTVLISTGTYRENVVLATKGTPDKPITIKAAPGQRVILSGSDPLDGWKKVAAADVGNHPQADQLFTITIPKKPEELFEGNRKMVVARTPDEGWWGITEGLSLSEFIDKTNLTQPNANAWDGWTVAILDQAGGGISRIAVKTYDPAAHKITLAEDYSKWRKKIDQTRDRYYMENHLAGLDGPGQYIFRTTEAGCTLIVWPSMVGKDGLPMIHAPRPGMPFTMTNLSNVIIDGLEVCFSGSHGMGMGRAGAPENVTIQNCYIHSNLGYGIELRAPVKMIIRRNLIQRNSHGIAINGSIDSVIEENDIGFNDVDGIVGPGGTRNLTIRKNYIHDHYLWGHPDNIQFWKDVEGVVIRDNVMMNSGQTMMSAEMKNTKLINNVWVGSHAIAMICGGEGWEITNNTVCATAPMPTNLSGSGYTLLNNIFAPLHGTPLYMMRESEGFVADHNILWPGPDYTKALVVEGAWKSSANSIEAIREKYKLEANGMVADPKFRNVPKAFASTDYKRTALATATTIMLSRGDASMFKVGDHIEIDFDGVVRKVTEVTQDTLLFDPAITRLPNGSQTIANWGDKTDFKWDIRPAEGSPAIKAGKNGTDIGSNLSIQDYVQGDFDSDGKRDLPVVPKE